jgi:hypothetical protein
MKLFSTLFAASLLALSGTAQAGYFEFDGDLASANDVVYGTFSVSDDNTGVSFLTTSYDRGSFDPALYLWSASGNLIGSYDDIAWDAGLLDVGLVTTLDAGNYYFTLVESGNANVSTYLVDGFAYDHAPAKALPGEKYWDIAIDGVSRAAVVPEPSDAAMLLVGLGIVGAVARRRSKRG